MNASKPRRIGLFGGTFDPVHNAHVALAQTAQHTLQLDEVRWIPAGDPWQKSRSITAALHRVAMVQLAMQASPSSVLDRIEVDRQGPSYTLDTVRALHAGSHRAGWASQYFLIIGQDQYSALHTWRQWQQLLSLVTLAVANRPGQHPTVNAEVQRLAHHMVPLPMLDVSSTQIRQRVSAGLDITPLVPPAVARYIEMHGLYRSPSVT